MAGLRFSGSRRAGLAWMVLLVGAIAVANCNMELFNNSPYYIQIFDVTTPLLVSPLPPKTSGQVSQSPLPNGTIPADSRLTFFDYFSVAPNTSAGAPSVSGDRNVFAIAYVRSNATITFFAPPDPSKAPGSVGLTISYNGAPSNSLNGAKSLDTAKMPVLGSAINSGV